MSKQTWCHEPTMWLLRYGRKHSGGWDDVDDCTCEHPDLCGIPDDCDTDLVCAAPDLLEALEAIIGLSDAVLPHGTRRQARAAIAKAKGES